MTLTSSAPSVAAVPASATVGQGNDSITFDVDTDAVTEAGDVWITATYNGVTQRVRLTVVPTSPTVTLESLSVPEYVARGESLTGSVTLSSAAPSGGITVTLAGSRAGIATIPASVTVPFGETSAEFTITTNASSPVKRGVHVTATHGTLVRDQWFVVNGGLEVRTPKQKPSTEAKRVGSSGRRSAPERHTFLPSHPVAHSLTASARSRGLISTTTDPLQRFYLYTPKLNLLAETELTTDSDPEIQYEYLWFAGQPVAQIETATNEIAWYFNDHLGTPLLQTDDTGDVIWRVEREPYGKIYEVRAGAERHQPLAFPGQEEQGGETSYNVFRWYRSGWGRYTQADPIGLRGGLNVFVYAADNPVRVTDPTGLVCGIDVWTEELTYSKQAGFAGAYKNAWGHKWITWPGGSAGFWPKETPTGPFQDVPGMVQIPDPNTKAKGDYKKHETYFDVFKTCPKCDQAVQCVSTAAQQLQASPPAYCLASNNCKDFVAAILSKCGLSETSTFEQLESMK